LRAGAAKYFWRALHPSRHKQQSRALADVERGDDAIVDDRRHALGKLGLRG